MTLIPATAQFPSGKTWVMALMWIVFDPYNPTQHYFREKKPLMSTALHGLSIF